MSSTEYDYVLSLENIGKYAGKWIAILGSKVIAEGESIEEVYQKALEVSDGQTPLFEQVPLKQEEETLIL